MIYKFSIIFSFLFSLNLLHAQNIDKSLQKQIYALDSLMQNNNPNIVKLLVKDVSFGHSNGWIQKIDDFEKDIINKKVDYNSVKQTKLVEFKTRKKITSVRRIVHVNGTYKDFDFKMDLSLLEIWIKKAGNWKLWSRQSIELKN